MIFLGLSGGVDSAVAAFLLKEQGHKIEAVFMQNWEEASAASSDPTHCSATQDLLDARAVCEKLDIPLRVINFAAEYWQRVFQYMLDEYAAGRTPNPDVMCNKEIKFKAFLEYAKNLGANYIHSTSQLERRRVYIATGHYARNAFDDASGKYKLLKGLDPTKDQSYFLHTLGQYELSHAIFPVGDLPKTEVRAIAKKIGLPNYAKKDSTGICFIGERKFKQFLSEYLLATPGVIVDADSGMDVGKHDGLMFYTLGQRQGLGIGGRKQSKEAPWYVVGKDIEHNQLLVSQEHDHPMLLSDTLHCSHISWVVGTTPAMPLNCTAKIRYRQEDQACAVMAGREGYQVNFQRPQWAITPGQSVVLYQGDECLGGGVIGAV